MEDDSKEKESSEMNEDNNDLIKLDLNKPEITKINILKKEGVPFKKDENIAICYTKDEKVKKKYIKSPINGWILKYISDEKKLILEPCKHDTFYVNLCVKCGFKKTEEYNSKNNTKSYGFLTKDFSYSKLKAETLEKSFVNNYLEKKKLILLLDLDNTIIHTSQIRISQEEIKYLQSLYNNYFSKIPIKNEFNRLDYIYVKFRPFLKTFLKNIKDKYEIFIYTQGTKEYATSIIQYINLNFESDSLSTGRMMCRVLDENGYAKHKSIKNVFPTQEKMVLIIDDHIEVWKESGDNFICIYPYKFFVEKIEKEKNLNIKEKFTKFEFDNVLFCITNLLLAVHRKFFDFYSKFQMQKNVKRITNDFLLSIFHGKKFYYHLNYYNCPNFNNKKTKKGKGKEKEKEKNQIKNEKEDINSKETKNNIDEKKKIEADKISFCDIPENKEIIEKKEKNVSIDYTLIESNTIKDCENKKLEEKEERINNNVNKRNLQEEQNTFDNIKSKIIKLGGQLIIDEKDIFDADLILTDFYDENDSIIKKVEGNNSNEKNKKLPIIHCHYIEICNMYLYEVNIEDFVLSQNFKFLKFLDLNKIFMKNKIDIINFYGNKDFIEDN